MMILLAVITKREARRKPGTRNQEGEREGEWPKPERGGIGSLQVLGVDPDPDERGPPTDWDLVDPAAPEM